MNTQPTNTLLFRLVAAPCLASLLFAGSAFAQGKLDLNSASVADLAALLCKRIYTDKRKPANATVCNAQAGQIVAARPYQTTAELVNRRVVSGNTARAIAADIVVVKSATTGTGQGEALPFPKAVDLSSKMSPARDQGRRGTCIAFSTTAGVEAFDKRLDLSEQHSFWQMREKGGNKATCLSVKYDAANPKLCQDRGCYGANMQTAVSILQSTGLVAEKDWAYDTTDNTGAGVNCHESITWASKLPAGLSSKKTVKLGRVEWLAGKGGYPREKRVDDPMVLMAILAQGYAVNIAIGVAGTGWRSGELIDVELDATTKKPVEIRGGHGLLLVGYDYDKKAFKFKNSWGSSWGQSGFGWLTFDYLKTYVTGGYYAMGLAR